MILHVVFIVLAALAIWLFSHMLSQGTNAIGKHYRIAPSVRGATLDAVASSFPELCTVIFALYAGAFDAGVGTVAGSALYNILVIPAVSALVGGPLKIEKLVIRRDGYLYVGVVLALIAAIWLGPEDQASGTHRLSVWVGLGGIAIYLGYVVVLLLQARSGKKQPDAGQKTPPEGPEPPAKEAGGAQEQPAEAPVSPLRIGAYVLFGIAGIGAATHFLVESSLAVFHTIGLSEAIAGVTILAAATSLPDTLLSVYAVRRGDADGAVSNAFGSNSFDILICLGLPVLVTGGAAVNWQDSWPILLFLFVSTMISVRFLITDWTLTRKEAFVMAGVYVLFIVLAFMGLL